MMAHYQTARNLLAVPLLAALALSGCVTTSDLDKLNQGVTGQVASLEETHKEQLAEVRTDLDGLQAGDQELRDELTRVSTTLSAVQSDMRAMMEVVKQGEDARARMEQKLANEIVQNREGLTAYAGQSADALQRMAVRSDEVSAQVKNLSTGLMQMFLGTYRAEEAALRERLKTVVETRQRLEAMRGAAQEVGAPDSGKKAVRTAPIERAQAKE